ncbi:hypothetical protein CR513_44648, partial [Mucuna pruriens]
MANLRSYSNLNKDLKLKSILIHLLLKFRDQETEMSHKHLKEFDVVTYGQPKLNLSRTLIHEVYELMECELSLPQRLPWQSCNVQPEMARYRGVGPLECV